jgi:hypothetical protein
VCVPRAILRDCPVLMCFSLIPDFGWALLRTIDSRPRSKVDVAPAQRGDLASPRAGEHGQPEQQPPFGVALHAASSALGGSGSVRSGEGVMAIAAF